MSGTILVKGTQEGLIVGLPEEGSAEEAVEALRAHLARAGAFFRGARVTLDVGGRALASEELHALRTLLEEHEVALAALRASDERTRAAANGMGIELPFVAPRGRPAPAQALPEESHDALLVRRTLRSGQSVQHPGAVTVIGDVNAGAEVVAGGDIVVWGALRGLVHAGALGDEGALVCALELAPTQLRIGQHIAVSPESRAPRKRRFWQRAPTGPETARVQGEQIVVEPGLPARREGRR